MDPYSGLVDMFEKQGLLKQQGNRLKFVDSTGKEHLDYRKDWTGDKLEIIMKDFSSIEDKYSGTETESTLEEEKEDDRNE